MHSSKLFEEAETLVGEDGPSTAAYQSLTYHQRIAILMLSRGASLNSIQVEVGKSARTLQYWMARRDFRQALHEATDARLKEVSAGLHWKSGRAAERLDTIGSDPTEPAGARVAANNAILTQTARMAATVNRSDQIAFLREEVGQLLTALRSGRPGESRNFTQESAIVEAVPLSLPSPGVDHNSDAHSKSATADFAHSQGRLLSSRDRSPRLPRSWNAPPSVYFDP